ncbi:MAG: type II toxin-antitoxin system mRNA interferase toxin, RelE/StbE family [Arcobacteraceae bacterium]|nr:type II toxin-antitoxin system mRNA interferase toxin, RelE/StbE family [Arcobacteraceae bacterium]
MTINYEKSFLKDIQKLNDKKVATKLKSLIEEFEQVPNLQNITNIKKLKGFEIYYRLKIGNYRLGFSYQDNQIDLIRFLHRKDIYKLFP